MICFSTTPAFATSLHCVQHWYQHPDLHTAMFYGHSVRVVGTILLLQEVIGALNTVPVGRSSMISGQGASCYSCCEVKLIQTSSLPATLHIALLGLLVIPIITQLATLGATVAESIAF